jgi:hypothetical protein
MKKPRRVIVVLELETAEGLIALKNPWAWQLAWNEQAAKSRLKPCSVLQAQANVAKMPKKVKK